jgi:hypothetical protein
MKDIFELLEPVIEKSAEDLATIFFEGIVLRKDPKEIGTEAGNLMKEYTETVIQTTIDHCGDCPLKSVKHLDQIDETIN